MQRSDNCFTGRSTLFNLKAYTSEIASPNTKWLGCPSWGGYPNWLHRRQEYSIHTVQPNSAPIDHHHILSSFFLQDVDIFNNLDEFGKLDRTTHAWIRFNFSLTQTQKTFYSSVMVKLGNKQVIWVQSLVKSLNVFFCKYYFAAFI